MLIRRFLKGERFNEDTIRVLGAALEMTCIAIRAGDCADDVKHSIADKIIAFAKTGERNPDVLCETVLNGIRGQTNRDTRLSHRSAIGDFSQNWLLAALEPADYALLVPHLRTNQFAQGTILQEQDAPVERVHFPLTGLVSLVSVLEHGAMVETAVVGREGAVGAFVGPGPWKSFARATVQIPAAMATISASHFHEAVTQSERIRDLILRYKEALLGQVQQTAACNTLHPVESRLARWLLQALDRTDGRDIPLTQEHLAEMLAVRRTTVTLLASRLQYSGLIRYRRGHIVVVDRVGLEEEACECYRVIRALTENVVRAPVSSAWERANFRRA